MIADAELELLLKEVGSQGRLVEVENVSPEDGQLLAGDADAIVTGDVLPGGLVQSKGNAVVGGEVKGQAERGVRIEAGGRVLVNGRTCHAQIAGSHLHLRQDVDHCLLRADRAILIGGDLRTSRLVVGDVQARKERCGKLRHEAAGVQEKLERHRAQLRFEGRRILKQARNTEVTFDLHLGNVLSIQNDTLEVSLDSVYRLSKDADRSRRDQMVGEFFGRVVIGALIKANRGYILKNRSRQGVFLRILGQLRTYFVMTRQCDSLKVEVAALRAQLGHVLAGLEQEVELEVVVGGTSGVDNEITFAVPRVKREGDQVTIDQDTAQLKVAGSQKAGICEVRVRDTEGREVVHEVQAGEMQGLKITWSAGRLAWDKRTTPAG